MKERFSLGPFALRFEKELERAAVEDWVARIWSKDTSLWKTDAGHAAIISKSLGWLGIADELRPRVEEIEKFAQKARGLGFRAACLLGMGGSSLCPEVCAETFGTRSGFLSLPVLDTTDPGNIARIEGQIDLERTLFLVSSKSGTTIESASLFEYFHAQACAALGEGAGRNFIAITDPDTALDRLARERGFLAVFNNPADIGGRYSALSLFGLVPMALIGAEIGEILQRASRMAGRCRDKDPAANPGLRLGAAMGALFHEKRDKLTFFFDPRIRTFGWWVEQLIAESTGKEDAGIIPIEGEPAGSPDLYGNDRVFVHVGMGSSRDPDLEANLAALEDAGHPLLRWTIEDEKDIAGEFFRWEFATAVAGKVLGINPFDQPNVEQSKRIARSLIAKCGPEGKVADPPPALSDENFLVYVSNAAGPALGNARDAREALNAVLGLAGPGEYVALLAYIDRSTGLSALLENLRGVIRSRLSLATTTGFGPRYLHSTGQLHKGGANNGLFLQITADALSDLEIPGAGYSFGALERAQAQGDFEALSQCGRRVLRIHLRGSVAAGLQQLARMIQDG